MAYDCYVVVAIDKEHIQLLRFSLVFAFVLNLFDKSIFDSLRGL